VILVLQTNVAGVISVWLVHQKKILDTESVQVEWHGSDRALAIVDHVLQKNKIQINKLNAVVVVRGPGSFTAVRTGLIIANTLGTLLHIPVSGVVAKNKLEEKEVIRLSSIKTKVGITVKPWYGKSPNITKAKPLRPQAVAKR